MKRGALAELAVVPALAPRHSRQQGWQMAAVALCLTVFWILAWYRSTALAMVEIWERSDTFTHGFFVAPISLWLVWHMRKQLASVAPVPCWWMLPLLAAAAFAWLLGELATINALTQFALVTMLVLATITILGIEAARKLAFPLAFLFFAVPIGDFLLPRLMGWTADFTVLGLRLSGIPVYQEAQRFVIPSGSWSVVEACSGIRYLIASLMVGTLFAYLTYRTTRRRLIFVAVAVAVPIVANWLRAYIIVMLGHLSGNTLAAGVDHYVYGWMFFGVVIAVVFWIGSRWREDLDPSIAAPAPNAATAAQPARPGSVAMAAAAVALIVIFAKIGYWAIERTDAAAPPQLASLAVGKQWLPGAASQEPWRPHFEEPSAELQQVFDSGDKAVGLFVAYYRNQDYSRKLVSSTNVLVQSTDRRWAQVADGSQLIDVAGEPVNVRTAILRRADGARMLVWQWYWINGRLTANAHRAKAYTALSRLQGRGDDSAAVVVSAHDDGAGSGRRALEAFITAAAPEINTLLRETRSVR